MSVDLAPIYLQAANVIRINGHCQNWFFDLYSEGKKLRKDCRVCTVGALSLAVTGDPVPPVVLEGVLREAIADLSARIYSPVEDDDPVERVAAWNDARGRTPADVIAAFEAAAKAVAA